MVEQATSSWFHVAAYVLVAIFSGFAGSVVTSWFKRKREAAETELVLAQAEQIRFATRKDANDLIDDLNLNLSELRAKMRHKDDQIHLLEEQIEMMKAGRIFDRNESAG